MPSVGNAIKIGSVCLEKSWLPRSRKLKRKCEGVFIEYEYLVCGLFCWTHTHKIPHPRFTVSGSSQTNDVPIFFQQKSSTTYGNRTNKKRVVQVGGTRRRLYIDNLYSDVLLYGHRALTVSTVTACTEDSLPTVIVVDVIIGSLFFSSWPPLFLP